MASAGRQGLSTVTSGGIISFRGGRVALSLLAGGCFCGEGELADVQRTAMNGRWPVRDFLELGALVSALPYARLHARHVLREWGSGICVTALNSWSLSW